jgi:uncharacterized repeat protein (TIGR01451 family)
VKVNRHPGTNLGRILCAGSMLLAVGCMVLASGPRARHAARNLSAAPSSMAPGAAGHGPFDLTASVENSPEAAKISALTAIAKLPLIFEPNVGQTDSEVKFLARGNGYSLYLGPDGAVMHLRVRGSSSRTISSTSAKPSTELVAMKLAGANPHARVTGNDPLPGKSNYFIGGDSSRWHNNIPQFARVRYENIYPGINLVFYGNQGQLEYDFQVAPGADPAQAVLQFDRSKQLELRDGSLLVRGRAGSVRLEAPRVYQAIDRRRQLVEGRFVLRAGNCVGFDIGPYDHTRELTIDPQLTFSTFFGGSGDESSPSVAVDNIGDIYLAGTTTSAPDTFPAASSTTTFGTTNIFVAKLDSTGKTVLFLSFLGGGGSDTSVGIAVDAGGNSYIAGTTTSGVGGSANFPTTGTNAYQTAPETGSTGTSHAFVSVLNAAGSALNYSSYLSGNGTDVATGMTIDDKGDLFVTGTTTSNDTPSVNDQFPASSPPESQPFQTFPRAAKQFFVTKVNTAAAGIGSIAYSTYFGGGTPSDPAAITATGGGIAVDKTANIYFTGTTNFVFTGSSPTTDFPILNAYQACLDTPPPTTITNPPTCTNTSATTNSDAFVAKLNPNAAQGSQLLWSTYLGGSGVDLGTAIAIDSSAANIYLTGSTTSTDFILPTGTAAFQSTNGGGTDAYVARFNNPTSGNMSLTYFSYLGGSGDDAGLAITVDTANGAILTGSTFSPDLPVTTNAGVIQSQYGGNGDAFFAHINTTTTTGQNTVGAFVSYFGGSGLDRGTGIAIDTSLNTYLVGDTQSPNLQTGGALQSSLNGPSDAFIVKLGTSADLCIVKTSTNNCTAATVSPTIVSAGTSATFVYTITNLGPDLATNITFTDNLTGVAVTFNSATAASGSCPQSASSNTIVCTIPSLQSGSSSTVTVTLTPSSAGSFNGGAVTVSSTENDPDPSNNSTTVTALATDFTVDVEPKNQSIAAAGDTALYHVTVSPLPPPFTTNISLSVSGLPSASSPSFNPNPVSLASGGPVTSALSIATTARPIPIARSGRSHTLVVAFVLPGLVLLGVGVGSERRRRRVTGILLCFILLTLLAWQPACSKTQTIQPTGGTPPGTYTLTLTATSGTLSHNQTFTITVP